MDNSANSKEQAAPQFMIEKMYLKDGSFEAPHTPEIFRSEWKPQVHLDLATSAHHLHDDLHEVVLSLTVTTKNDNKNAYLVEVKYAGIFTLRQFSPEQLKEILGSFCPSLLYPYGAQAISDLVMKGGFPHIHLSPINFDAVYRDSLARQSATDKQEETTQQ